MISQIFGAVKIATYLFNKFMDGKKTKTGLAGIAAGTGISVLTVLGVNVTPEMAHNALVSLLGVFNLNLTGDANIQVGVLLGAIVAIVSSLQTLYGYNKKDKFVKKEK